MIMLLLQSVRQEADGKQKRLKERARQLIEEARAGIGQPEMILPKRPSKDLTSEEGRDIECVSFISYFYLFFFLEF